MLRKDYKEVDVNNVWINMKKIIMEQFEEWKTNNSN